jgi:nucleotide-binding universal stress UspA family protein
LSDRPLLPRKIIASVDGSLESFTAARYSIELARMMNAEIVALHVVQLPEYISEDVRKRLKDELIAKGETALIPVEQAAQASGVHLSVNILSTASSVVDAICEFARTQSAGMIIMGTRGMGGVAKLMLGSVAAGVVRAAPCPVLVVR